jgi:hypothetical protein
MVLASFTGRPSSFAHASPVDLDLHLGLVRRLKRAAPCPSPLPDHFTHERQGS